jgi:hypothetical protein
MQTARCVVGDAKEDAMSVQWKIQVRDLLKTFLSRFGMSEHVPPTQKVDLQGPNQHYQNPGRDKNHPGDDADVRASTELHKEQAAKL